MELLKERIRKEGKILPGNIVKVDGFLNHRIDVPLMEQIAQEFRRVFAGKDITLVLTAEASGIALATICAQAFGVPMVFAKKAKSDNIEGGLYQKRERFGRRIFLWLRVVLGQFFLWCGR